MVSSKGKPTDPKLREEVKKDVQNEPNKDGEGKGQWAAWKATKLSKEYEAKGGGYENDPGSKNEPSKGTPEPKSDEKKETETKNNDADAKKDTKEKPKANSGKKATTKKGEGKAKAPKERKPPAEGSRRSARLTGKREAPEAEESNQKVPAKKPKTAK